jgi:hypothetical protein
MEREIIALAGSSPLPKPVERIQNGDDCESPTIRASIVNMNGSLHSSPAKQIAAQVKETVAPYQALPVDGRIITEHLTAALPVFNPEDYTQEVSCRIIDP